MVLGTDADGQDLYNELVDQEGVCRNCFARTHDYTDEWPPITIPTSLRGVLQTENFDSIPLNVEQVFPPEKQTRYPPSRNICKCGVFSRRMKAWGTEDPLSRREFKRNVKNLCVLIEEEDIEFSKFRFVYSALERKADPGYQSRDEKVFHDALEEAVLPYVERDVDETAQQACGEV